MKLHRCKCHGRTYITCAVCSCAYCPVTWPAGCPRCADIKRLADLPQALRDRIAATRFFCPVYIDTQQAETYRLIGWTVPPDGPIVAHFADGHTTLSIHPSIDHLRAESRITEVKGLDHVRGR